MNVCKPKHCYRFRHSNECLQAEALLSFSTFYECLQAEALLGKSCSKLFVKHAFVTWGQTYIPIWNQPDVTAQQTKYAFLINMKKRLNFIFKGVKTCCLNRLL
ncbi:MAG: hypothetical protein J1G30_07000 [Spirochaetales bacterium]|nr:hypothetical protein [Spirochaetales bacterium]